jgi:hypothetical protein
MPKNVNATAPYKSSAAVTVAGTAVPPSSAVAIHVTTAGVVTFTMAGGSACPMYLTANTPHLLPLSIVNIASLTTAVLGNCQALYNGAES